MLYAVALQAEAEILAGVGFRVWRSDHCAAPITSRHDATSGRFAGSSHARWRRKPGTWVERMISSSSPKAVRSSIDEIGMDAGIEPVEEIIRRPQLAADGLGLGNKRWHVGKVATFSGHAKFAEDAKNKADSKRRKPRRINRCDGAVPAPPSAAPPMIRFLLTHPRMLALLNHVRLDRLSSHPQNG